MTRFGYIAASLVQSRLACLGSLGYTASSQPSGNSTLREPCKFRFGIPGHLTGGLEDAEPWLYVASINPLEKRRVVMPWDPLQ